MAWTGTWEGGRIWTGKRGRQTYVIRRELRGKKYEVSTRCTSRRTALAQLDAFEKDPERYDPRGAEPKAKIVLDADLIDRFEAWSRDVKRNTPRWIEKQRVILEWWAEQLKGVDLRRAQLKREILPALDGAPSRQHRIACLKVLYAWLRTVEHEIGASEDPTLDALTVPQSKPAQWTKSRVVPRDHLHTVIATLPDPEADLLRVLGSSGAHVSELERFAERGKIEPLPVPDPGMAGVLLFPRHKSGGEHRVRVREEARAAAARVLKRGPFSVSGFEKAIRAACDAAKVQRFGPGSVRHSVATWAIEAGADPMLVSSFLGHRSAQTMKRFYATNAAPRGVPVPV